MSKGCDSKAKNKHFKNQGSHRKIHSLKHAKILRCQKEVTTQCDGSDTGHVRSNYSRRTLSYVRIPINDKNNVSRFSPLHTIRTVHLQTTTRYVAIGSPTIVDHFQEITPLCTKGVCKEWYSRFRNSTSLSDIRTGKRCISPTIVKSARISKKQVEAVVCFVEDDGSADFTKFTDTRFEKIRRAVAQYATPKTLKTATTID